MKAILSHFIHILFISVLLCSSCRKQEQHFNSIQILKSGTTNRLNAITVSDNVIYIAGGDRFTTCNILISRDNGDTWEVKDFPQAGKALYGITSNSAGHIYTCGFDGKLLWSTDKGYTWNFTQIGDWQPYKDLDFIDEKRSAAVMGVSYNSGGNAILDSSGSILKYDSTKTEYNDIEMLNQHIGYIAGYGVVMKTTDGGLHWSYQNIKNDNFSAISALSENDLWVCGVGGSLYHTTDGGYNWNRKRNGNDLTIAKYHFHDILFIDSRTGWAVGDDGVVLGTTDGGEKWSPYSKFTSSALRSIAILPDGKLLICGDNGGVYKLQR